MLTQRASQALAAYESFVNTPLDALLSARADLLAHLRALLARTVDEVPAYAAFLKSRGADPSRVKTLEDFAQLPLATKVDYIQAYPLAQRCRGGALENCDMIAVSSGSTGEPTIWPRFLSDELTIAQRFEQIFHDSFEAHTKSTLAVVCFPLGTWVGGMFTTQCLRHVAAKGYPLTVVTPGNNKLEILRAVRSLGASFEQVVLLGYPPFVKEVIDLGISEGIQWRDLAIKMVFAGEVFSEEWRTLVGERAGMERPLHDSAALYGTADAGVLGNETPISIAIRRFLSTRPDATRALFGESRLPTLVQYDPFQRYFEVHEQTLLFSGDNGVPLIRYHISDSGGVYPYRDLLARVRELGFDEVVSGARELPFLFVFGRSHFALSYYGANVFPEMVSIGLEGKDVSSWVTGKFVMEILNGDQLTIAVELAKAAPPDLAPLIARTIHESLRRLSSEFANYVPAARQLPTITLRPQGDPTYFPVGVKHRYSRR